jgi:hypothetical protein
LLHYYLRETLDQVKSGINMRTYERARPAGGLASLVGGHPGRSATGLDVALKAGLRIQSGGGIFADVSALRKYLDRRKTQPAMLRQGRERERAAALTLPSGFCQDGPSLAALCRQMQLAA